MSAHDHVAVPFAEHGGPLAFLTEKQEARFWSKIERGEPDACWPWKAATAAGDYGKFQITTGWREPGKPKQIHVRAPRLALALASRTWPTLYVLHSCDNPICCNPAHLREGTQSENIREMDARGRRGHKPLSAYLRRDTGHPNAKVTSADIERMREMRLSGATVATVAAAFGIHHSRVHVYLGNTRRLLAQRRSA